MSSCGKKKRKDYPGFQGMSVVQLRQQVQHLYPYLTKLNNVKRQELCDILSRNCDTLGGLTNKVNSCYIDSILMALFHNHNPYLKENVINKQVKFTNSGLQDTAVTIQDMLSKINDAIVQGKRGACSRLRAAFQQFDRIYSNEIAGIEQLDWKNSQLEPADVIKALIRVFNIPNDCRYRFQTYGVKGRKKYLITNETRETTFADALISADSLYEQSKISMKQFIPIEKTVTEFDTENLWKPNENMEFSKKLVIKTYIKAPIFVVHVSRVFGNEKLTTPIVPEVSLKLKDNKHILHLRSIIVHHGNSPDSGHYTCYLLCQNTWFHYNDINFTGLEEVGDLKKVLKHDGGFVLRNAVNFIYF